MVVPYRLGLPIFSRFPNSARGATDDIWSHIFLTFLVAFLMLGSLRGLSLAEECSQVQVLKCHCEAFVHGEALEHDVFCPVALGHSFEQFCGTFWACEQEDKVTH